MSAMKGYYHPFDHKPAKKSRNPLVVNNLKITKVQMQLFRTSMNKQTSPKYLINAGFQSIASFILMCF